jgi:hypothetical protein
MGREFSTGALVNSGSGGSGSRVSGSRGLGSGESESSISSKTTKANCKGSCYV